MYDKRAIKFYENGRALQQMGKLADAERAYRKATKISSNFFEAHTNLGNLQLEKGRLKEAVTCYRNALQWLPNHPMLLNNLGNALQLGGRNEQALEYLSKAVRIEPNYAEAHCNLGNALHALGRQEEAVASFREALNIEPDLIEAYNNLGNILLEQKEIQEAIATFRRAVQVDPRHRDAHHGLGNSLRINKNWREAAAAYRRAIEIDPRHADAYESLGRTLAALDEYESAITAYRKAIEIDPKFAAAYWGLGRELGYTGNNLEAIEALRKLTELDPDRGNAYRMIATNKKFVQADDDLHAMETQYARQDISDEFRMHLAFGLGKACEDLGEYDKSMQFILEANNIMQASREYSQDKSRNLFNRIKSTYSREFMASVQDQGNPDSSAIFILGMPRSGTSLAEQILASHPDVFGAGELEFITEIARWNRDIETQEESPEPVLGLTPAELKACGDSYLEKIRKLSPGSRFVTDKMPHNFKHIGLIRAILPNARIIHMQRDPIDTCLSMFKNFFGSGHLYSYNQTDLGEYYKLYLDLMAHWKDLFPGFIFDLSYEKLISDPEHQIRNLLRYCELPWNDACLAFHETRRLTKTASLAQVRRPIYKDSINLWQRYENSLQPLIAALD